MFRKIPAGKLPSDPCDWAAVNEDRMDELYDLVPDASLPFECKKILFATYNKYNGNYGAFKELMNDRNIRARRNVEAVILNGWVSLPVDGVREENGYWRLMFEPVVYSEPWKTYTWKEIEYEYKGEDHPYKQYIHHLIQRFEGEVAIYGFALSPTADFRNALETPNGVRAPASWLAPPSSCCICDATAYSAAARTPYFAATKLPGRRWLCSCGATFR